MPAWQVALVLNLASAVALGLGYAGWGRRAEALDREFEAARAHVERLDIRPSLQRIYNALLSLRKSRCKRQKNISRKSVMDRRRVRTNQCSGLASAAAIPTHTKLFIAFTLSRRTGKTEDNSRRRPRMRSLKWQRRGSRMSRTRARRYSASHTVSS